MSPEANSTKRRWGLALVGLMAIALAGATATYGITFRAKKDEQVAQWTAQQAIPTVALAKLATGDAGQSLTLPGTVQPFNRAPLYARVSGYLKAWSKDIGATVKSGEVLATIETPDLDQQLAHAVATLASGKANADIAALTSSRYDILAKKAIVAQQLADQASSDTVAKTAAMDAMAANVRQLQAMQAFKRVVAPVDGVVTARNTDIGALISAGGSGQPLFEVSDLHRVRIFVHVPQAYSAQVIPGGHASFELPQFPGRQIEAAVVTTSKAFDAATRSLLVELQADNATGELLAGAYCKVRFELPSTAKAVRIPATALVPVNRGAQVVLLGDNNRVTLQAVQVGRDFGDSIEVVNGLAISDRVIDSPPENLRTGDQVQLAPPPAPSPAGPADPKGSGTVLSSPENVADAHR